MPPSPPAATSASGEVLAVRLPNWVGDVCMALPALARLQAAGGTLACFGKGWAVDLLAGLPYRVQRLPTGMLAAAAALRATGARRGVLFTNSFTSALHMRLAGIAAVGYRQELRSPLLALPVRRVAGVHEVEAFWRLAAVSAATGGAAPRAGAPTFQRREPLPAPPPAQLGLALAGRHRDEAHAALAAAGVGGPYSVLCPLAVGLIGGRSKQWPSFPLLCRALIEAGETVVACPGPGEEAAAAACLPGARLLGGLGLGAYAAVLAGGRRVVANDSGPMHLAAAVGTPVLGIFGVSDPGRTRPWGAAVAVVGDGRGWPTVQAVWSALDRLPTTAQETRA